MKRFHAFAQLHAAALLYGLSALFGQALSASPVMIVLGRAAFALAVLLPLCAWRRSAPWHALPPRDSVKLVLLGTALAVHWLLFFVAIQVGGVAVATLGFATFPAFTALGERLLFSHPMAGKDWAIIGLASLGLMLVGPAGGASHNALAGLGWGVLSGATYAGIAIANKRMNLQADGLHLSVWQMVGIVLALLPFAGDQWGLLSAKDWLLLAGLGVLCTGVAYTLFIGSLKVVSANTAAVVIAMEPVYAIVGAWLLFGDRPTLAMVAGGGLILCAVAWAGQRPDTAGETASQH
ncbi:DMT family transporter [Pseudomonas japonica]|uniref:DMT family transporter n=1 Tax=Pseudomonas japonica TaxID=256466 RepID=UPI0015E45481|nr:DMT family transporter [Pseudomonas japonica]MBA1290399.1 DMT family transporter [Pseudomonas japonica]